MPALVALLVSLVAAASPARAERTIANDTVSPSTPASVQCGFCTGERFGAVFVPDASEYPLDLVDVRIAIAAALRTGIVSCEAQMDPGEPRTSRIEIWAGDAAEPAAEPGGDGEQLVWSFDGAPLVASTAATGTRDITVTFTTIPVEDAMRLETASYLRVLLDVPAPLVSMPARCAAAGTGDDPDSFPIADRDGIMPHRNLVYSASGTPGWSWAEDLGIAGDWAVRLTVQTRPGPRDAGPSTDGGRGDAAAPDAGADAGAPDTGARDAAAAPDAAAPRDAGALDATSRPASGGDGCDCRTAPRSASTETTTATAGPLLSLAVGVALARRRRRSRRGA